MPLIGHSLNIAVREVNRIPIEFDVWPMLAVCVCWWENWC